MKRILGQNLLVSLLLTLLLAALSLPILVAAQNCPLCAYCGKPISGAYYSVDGRDYHADCYRDHVAPRCEVCGEPIMGEYVTYEGKNYHRSCYERTAALRCSVCGQIIEGEYYLDPWGNPFHAYHADDIPMCRFCGRLISDNEAGGGVKFDDQYYICNHCAQDVVTEAADGEKLLTEVRSRLLEAGIDVGDVEVEFHLVSRDELSKVSGMADVDNYGLAIEKTTGYFLGLLKEKTYAIYILAGLPRMYFISTAGHELMHIWLYQHGVDGMDRQMVEGSCDMASVLVLGQYDHELIPLIIKQIEQNPNPLYGEGCRRIQRIVENRGVEYWLGHLQFDPEFPIGY
jgi:hypothetical protein